MFSSFLRPRVADLVFRVYDRPLHPELVEAVAVRRVCHDGSTLTVRITATGHQLEWSQGPTFLTELTACEDLPLPEAGRKLTHRFRGEQRGRCQLGPGVRYQVSLSAEVLAPEVFLHVHEDLATDGARRGLLFHFRPHHRLGLTPLGLVTAEAVRGGISIASFHTFPDEFTILKTQSLIEV
jgi:hypothetical protein